MKNQSHNKIKGSWNFFEEQAYLVMTEPYENQSCNARINYILDGVLKLSIQDPTKAAEGQILIDTLLNSIKLTKKALEENKNTRKVFNQTVREQQEDVPSDGNCFFWASARQLIQLLKTHTITADALPNSFTNRLYANLQSNSNATNLSIMKLIWDAELNQTYSVNEVLVTRLEYFFQSTLRSVLASLLDNFKESKHLLFQYEFMDDIGFVRSLLPGAIADRPISAYKPSENSNTTRLREIAKFHELENEIVKWTTCCSNMENQEIIEYKVVNRKISHYIKTGYHFRENWLRILDNLKNLLAQNDSFVGEEAALLMSYLFPNLVIKIDAQKFDGTVQATQIYFQKMKTKLPAGVPIIHLFKVPWAHYNSAGLIIKNIENKQDESPCFEGYELSLMYPTEDKYEQTLKCWKDGEHKPGDTLLIKKGDVWEAHKFLGDEKEWENHSSVPPFTPSQEVSCCPGIQPHFVPLLRPATQLNNNQNNHDHKIGGSATIEAKAARTKQIFKVTEISSSAPLGKKLFDVTRENASYFDISSIRILLSNTLIGGHTLFKNYSDYIVLISNSRLDGFREGDGDLMDKLCYWFNKFGFDSIRIVERSQNSYKNEIDECGPIQAYLSEEETKKIKPEDEKKFNPCELESIQKTFFNKVCVYLNQKKKIIIYIGSRFGSASAEGLTGSGSIFTKDFIRKLQAKNVKVVICCLEFKFFKRSIEQLPKAFQMLRQQLFLADRIHFLNAHDQSNFNKTLTELKENTCLQPHSGVRQFSPDEVKELKEFDLNNDIKENCELHGIEAKIFFEKMNQKTIFVSGIYTVKPMLFESSEDDIISTLVKRPKNILCFGLIRSNKGIEEAIEVGQQFKKIEIENKIIIIGKAMTTSAYLIKCCIGNIYGITPSQVENKLMPRAIIEAFLELKSAGNKFNAEIEEIVEKEIQIIQRKMIDFEVVYTNSPDEYKDSLARWNKNYTFHCALFIFYQFWKVLVKTNPSDCKEYKITSESAFGVHLQNIKPNDIASIKGRTQFIKIIRENKFDKHSKEKLESETKSSVPQHSTAGKLPASTFSNLRDIDKKFFKGDSAFFNTMCRRLKELAENRTEKNNSYASNIHIEFDIPELKLREYAMLCRYAIKIDHKGMANNASTIASCLGMYLPTFTNAGMLTGDDFRDEKLHRRKNNYNKFFSGKYKLTLIMPKKEYNPPTKKPFEITPKSESIVPLTENILKVINESDKDYGDRIGQLRTLFNDKVFDTKSIASNLIEKLFTPLTKEYN